MLRKTLPKSLIQEIRHVSCQVQRPQVWVLGHQTYSSNHWNWLCATGLRNSTQIQHIPGRDWLISPSCHTNSLLSWQNKKKKNQRSVKNEAKNFEDTFLRSLFLNKQQIFVILLVIILKQSFRKWKYSLDYWSSNSENGFTIWIWFFLPRVQWNLQGTCCFIV